MSRDQKSSGQAASSKSLGADGGKEADPREMMLKQRIRSANRFNAAHLDLVEKFNQATGGECAGENGVDAFKVIAWQRAHGIKGEAIMDAATKERLADARALLAELGAAQQQALTLLDEIEQSLKRGDTEQAITDEAILRDELGHIGDALLLFSKRSVVTASGEA